jgi:hypothetical protein
MLPKVPGNSGRYFSVLKCASEKGLSLETCGLECVFVTPRSAANPDSLVVRTWSIEGRVQGSALVQFLRSEESGIQLLLRAEGGVGSVQRLTLLPLLENLTTRPDATLVSVLKGNLRRLVLVSGSEERLGAGVHLAPAVSRALSLQASLRAQLRGQRLQGRDEQGQSAESERASFAFGQFVLRDVW